MSREPARVKPWDRQPPAPDTGPVRGTPRSKAQFYRKGSKLAELARKSGPLTTPEGELTPLGQEFDSWGARSRGESVRLANRMLARSRGEG